MIFTVLAESAERGELILVQDGLCRWHRRKDGVVVIHEILVLPFRRRTGVGRRLIQEVIERNSDRVIRAKCPVKYTEANLFWQAMGFALLEEREGVNLWQKPRQG